MIDLKDLVEIIEKMKTPNIILNTQNYKCSKKMFSVLHQKD